MMFADGRLEAQLEKRCMAKTPLRAMDNFIGDTLIWLALLGFKAPAGHSATPAETATLQSQFFRFQELC